ncbi:hypothetical protein FB45DRAFT_924777 [Roridomyces roridus]|uniref:Uncharacterized protein n=1 Tax=Roridomyces roridus TaxID=1738132 RepID=A0AAD7BJF9_9AGAR|nr:hypothetical protein FB45DRAFT_924777 [Roridomyces roridus]
MILDHDAPPAYEATNGTLLPPGEARDIKQAFLVPSSQKSAASWLGYASPSAQQVRRTVLSLLRDLVRYQNPETAISILNSCASACSAHSLALGAVLQEQSIEGHTPLYWAIIKRPTALVENQDFDLLTVLLGLSSPISDATISDIRLACLLMRDQALFQRLRTCPAFGQITATEEMLLDTKMAPDDISVQDAEGDSFAVDFTIARFQKRMLVGKSVVLEFIARGRMWRLSFNVSTRRPVGHWYLALSIIEESPPAWVDSRLVVSAPDAKRPLPTVSLRLRATEQLRPQRRNDIRVPLDGSELGGLRYVGCPYIAADETFYGRLEARLFQPEGECIIC